jgi:alkanesulfonate monooxygenase SsuD/methylene tetrahydromethanopterin reductase-like flavin-dependent oxidoreductase (luciferase family)
MRQRPFRFGVVAAPTAGAPAWLDTARRAERLGYQVLLTPDNLRLPTPTVSLAMAASVTSTLRVGSYVLAGPLRTPRAAAWDAHSLAVLTGGRFELGLGTGLPSMREQAQELGLGYRSGAGRLAQLTETIEHVLALAPDRPVPVLIAAGGPKARALAAANADIVTLADPALTGRAQVADHYAEVLAGAGDRAEHIELAMNLFVIGDQVPAQLRGFVDVDAATLVAHDSVAILRGTPIEMADELRRRRDAMGVSYIVVNGLFTDQLAPVVERLAGQ